MVRTESKGANTLALLLLARMSLRDETQRHDLRLTLGFRGFDLHLF